MHKSIHFANTRMRDCFMNISMLSQESTLMMFTDNLIELSLLFEAMSPTVVSFFENCFLQTEFCKDVKNVDWATNSSLYVFGRNS
jgi:hypothetical protein